MLNDKKGISRIALILIIVSILVIGAVAIVLFLNKDNSTNIDNTVNNINKNNADKEDNSLNNIDVGGNITESIVRNYKTASASDFEYEETDGGIKITKYTGNDVIVVIPDKINGKNVVELKNYLFANNSSVKGVSIPNTVKTLKYTFINNSNIQVVICEGVESLLDFVFGNCSALHTLMLGKDLRELGEFSISTCPSLSEVYISSKVQKIDIKYDSYDVFSHCPNIVVKGENGSYIQQYCQENGIKFETNI